ncbi:hypothetical protein PMIN02_013108 [Paraphaeosphaeria minitans]
MTARTGPTGARQREPSQICRNTNQQGRKGSRNGGPGGVECASWVNRHLRRRLEIGRSVECRLVRDGADGSPHTLGARMLIIVRYAALTASTSLHPRLRAGSISRLVHRRRPDTPYEGMRDQAAEPVKTTV